MIPHNPNPNPNPNRKDRTMNARQKLVAWYQSWIDGDWDTGTPNELAGEWENSPCEMDAKGDIWVPAKNCWKTEDDLADFVEWLKGRKAI